MADAGTPDAGGTKVYEPGVPLTEEQKGEILADVSAQKKAAQQEASSHLQKKKAIDLGLKGGSAVDAKPAEPKPAPAASGEATPSGKKETGGSTPATPRAAGGGAKAAKALSPEKGEKEKKKPGQPKAEGKEAAGGGAKAAGGGAKAAGGGAKAAAALKAGGKGKAPGGAKKGGKKKAAEKGETSAAGAAAPAAAPVEAESPAQAEARMAAEEAAREAERERLYKEREAQRQEIEQQIIAEERRVRELERRRREKEQAERKKQAALREAAFDGEVDEVKRLLASWVEECFGAELIGAKIDATDENKHTALSEAAVSGQTEVCELLLKHGASVNQPNAQNRTPLWRACFMDHAATAALLLKHGGDPRVMADSGECAAMVAPSAELKASLAEWDDEKVKAAIAARDAATSSQWIPPPPKPEEQPAGQPGYFLQIGLPALADALDSVTQDADRTVCLVDLSGKALTYFTYRDVNMCCYARPNDIEPATLRKSLLGAMRYGKPFVLDMMGMPLEKSTIEPLFECVREGLFSQLLHKQLVPGSRDEGYRELIREDDGNEYKTQYWSETTSAHFQFVLLTKLPLPPEWCAEEFFVIRVAGG